MKTPLCRLPSHKALRVTICLLAAPSSLSAERQALPKPASAMKPMTSDQKVLFDLIAELVAKRPLRVGSLSSLLGRAMKEDRSSANAYFTIYQLPRSEEGIVLEGELRESKRVPKEGPVDGFLSLEINPRLCIRKEAVQKQFGHNPIFTPPSAHASSKAPFYLSYGQAWGQLSFGFSQSKPSCLMRVILDAVKPEPPESL